MSRRQKRALKAFKERAAGLLTEEMRQRIEDEQDPQKRGAAIVSVLEEDLPIIGGMEAPLTDPRTRLIFNEKTGEIRLKIPDQDVLFDADGNIHLLCDTYAALVGKIWLPRLSVRSHQAYKIRNIRYEEAKQGELNHFRVRFNLGDSEHSVSGIPRCFRSFEGEWTEVAPKALVTAMTLGERDTPGHMDFQFSEYQDVQGRYLRVGFTYKVNTNKEVSINALLTRPDGTRIYTGLSSEPKDLGRPIDWNRSRAEYFEVGTDSPTEVSHQEEQILKRVLDVLNGKPLNIRA